MAAKAAGEIKNIKVFVSNPVLIENDVQAGDVRAFGLRQFVNVALGEINRRIAFYVQNKFILALFEAAQMIDPVRPQKFAQQIHEAGTANALRRNVADDSGLNRAVGGD